MSEYLRNSDPDDKEDNDKRPSGAGPETVIIGGNEYWYSPESGTVLEVPDTDTSDETYNPEHDDYVEGSDD